MSPNDANILPAVKDIPKEVSLTLWGVPCHKGVQYRFSAEFKTAVSKRVNQLEIDFEYCPLVFPRKKGEWCFIETKTHLNTLFLYPHILCVSQNLGPFTVCFKGVSLKKYGTCPLEK